MKEMHELFALVLTLAVHELGHITAARSVGVGVGGIHMRSGGLSIEAYADSVSYMRAFIIYIGGAAANIAAALIFRDAIPLSAYCVGAAVFNLLPLPASDGTMIIYTLAAWLTDSPNTSYRISRGVTDLTLVVFWLAAVYMSMTGRGDILPLIFAGGMLVVRLGEG